MSTPGREGALDRVLATANYTLETAPLYPISPPLDAIEEAAPPPLELEYEFAHDHEPTLPADAPLATLPPELLDGILAHVPPSQRTRASLALAEVLRHEPSRQALWEHVVVRRGSQMLPLWKRLREEGKKPNRGGAGAAKTFALESWRGDADILNNCLRCLPNLRTIMLNCGTNFLPEHLQEMFEDPRPSVQRLELRFRPYVEQASYIQFLRGSYFDTAIETLTRYWPETEGFTQCSIIQDLPPRNTKPPKAIPSPASLLADDMMSLRLSASAAASTVASSVAASRIGSTAVSRVASAAASASASAAASAANSDTEDTDDSTPPTSVDSVDETSEPALPKGYTGKGPFPYLSDKLQPCKPKSFAQPIVFFDIQVLARFGASPVAKHLTHLRLRVPSRDMAYVLVSPPAGMQLFPSLKYLDISSTNVRLDAVLATLLRSYPRLEHLVLDRVNLFGFRARERGADMCKELGTMCVTAGLNRGKERERQIAAWDLAERTRMAQRAAERRRQQPDDSNSDLDEEERAARTAEREAQAMRDEMARQIALARSRRGHRSAAHSTISLRDRPSRRRQSNEVNPADLPAQDRLYFVLPPLPTLKSVSIGGEAPLLKAWKPTAWEDEFNAGWRQALATLLGWAAHVADKYERAQKKADEWRLAQTVKPSKGKAKAKPSTTAKPPPLDIKLFRFPTPDEPLPPCDPDDPTVGLVEVHPERPREYLDAYKDAIAEAELYTHSQAHGPPCVLCTTPDCEGPYRRGGDGERVDGRGGMERPHVPGCGHAIGRRVWGWESVL